MHFMLISITTLCLGSTKNQNDTDQDSVALNFAQSEEMYHKLRADGANFEITPFVKFYPITSTVTALAVTATCLYLYKNEYFAPNRFSNYFKNLHARINNAVQNIKSSLLLTTIENNSPRNANDMHSIDEFGRTALMNYIMTQEEQLCQLRAKIILESNQDTYFWYESCSDLIVEHQNLKNTMIHDIKTMIEQGAPLDTLDYQGKSLLNYCQTDEIYRELRKSGAPLDLIPGAYFTGRPLCKFGFIIAGVALIFVGFVQAVYKGELGNHYYYYY